MTAEEEWEGVDVSPDRNLVSVRYQEGSPVAFRKIGVIPASGGNPRFIHYSILPNEIIHHGRAKYPHARAYKDCTDVWHSNIA